MPDPELMSCNATRLALALNFSIFLDAAAGDRARARELAARRLREALTAAEALEEEALMDARAILEVLRENLALWGDPDSDGDDGDAPG